MLRHRTRKGRFVGIRMSIEDVEVLQREALKCGLPLSELIRRRTTGGALRSRTDEEIVLRVERVARALKHLCPADQVTAEDRSRWSSLARELEQAARVLRQPKA